MNMRIRTPQGEPARYKWFCDVCPNSSKEYDTRDTAARSERKHLIKKHGGAKVFSALEVADASGLVSV